MTLVRSSAFVWLLAIPILGVATGVAVFDISLNLPWQASGARGCVGQTEPAGGPAVAPDAGPFAADGFELRHTLGDPAKSGLPKWPAIFDAVPTAYDINGDGSDELVAQSSDTKVYVFETKTGRAVATLPTICPDNWYVERVLNEVGVGVLGPGEPPTIIVTNHAAYVTAWQYVPADSSPDRFVFQKRWETRANTCVLHSSMDAGPALVDLDRDGTLEVLVQTEELGLYALNADGTVRWHHCWAGGNSAPATGDLDGDGDVDAVFASDSGFIAVLEGATGAPLWTFDAADPLYGITPASVSVTPTIAELDGLPGSELVFTARHAPAADAALFETFHMAIFAVHRNQITWQPELLWMRQPEWANPLSYTRLHVLDVDGDGLQDIFGMDWNTIGHNPGNWETLGPAHLFRLDALGQDVWVHEVDAWWSNKDIAVADTDADGVPEILANGANGGADGFGRYDAASGEALDFLTSRPWQVLRGPLLLNLHHDGGAQLAFTVGPKSPTAFYGAILVYELEPKTTMTGV